MFDGSILPRRRVSMARGPVSINRDKEETIKKYKNGRTIAVFMKGFIERKRWKLQLQQQLNLLKSEMLQHDGDLNDEIAGKIFKMIRLAYFARIRDFETLIYLSRLVDLGKITKKTPHLILLKLFHRLFMNSAYYKSEESLYPLVNTMYIFDGVHCSDFTNFLAYAGSVALSKMEISLLDKVSLILKKFATKIDFNQFYLTFLGSQPFDIETLNNRNLTKIFDSISASPPDCLFISHKIIYPPLFEGDIFSKNVNTLLETSTNGDLIQAILLTLTSIPNIIDNIKADWPKLFRIIGVSQKNSLFITINYSKYLKDPHLSTLATCFFSSKLIKCIRDHFDKCCNEDISQMISAIDAVVLLCRIYLYVDMILYDSEIINGFFLTVDNAKWIGCKITQLAVYIDFAYNNESNSQINRAYNSNSIICEVSKKIALRLSRMNIIKCDEWVVNEYLDKTNPFPPVPHAIPFSTRVQCLRQQTCFEIDPRFIIYNRPYLIRRTHIVEDSLETLGHMGCDKLRLPFRVAFVDEFGNPEDGVDGGGIFKEFLLTLSKCIFDPSYGLFQASNDSDMSLLPSISSGLAHENHLEMFNFVGIIVGKALFEGILIEPVLSRLLLNLILGHRNGFDELKYFDPQLHTHLLKLISLSTKELADLDLNFTTTINSLGVVETHELVLNGENKKVDRTNVHEYIWKLASFKCNTLIESQSAAFLHGVSKLIPLEWLRNFSPSELQLLISGSPLIDVQDMKRNTIYSGYTSDSTTIKYFWEIVEQQDMCWRSEFLAFVTSCKRAPLLGFAHLKPQLCITLEPDVKRLPTSATCTNLLKLPDFRDKRLLSEKLDVAMKNCQGFLLD